ncbi:MAG: hypothetical protein IKP69_10485, partial [Oscillospiraceae bacterium]|nr:hypothetical protein [Oscillospiraceae bacterium]
MKKRNLAVICAVCMICSGAFLPETALPSPVLTACAEDTAGKIGVLTYEKLDSGIRITACDPEAETVEIP